MKRNGSGAKKQNRIRNYALRLAALLILLVGGSFWTLTGLLARYTGGAAGSDAAGVASFRVSAKGDRELLSVDCSDADPEAAYTIFLRNDSGVAVSYDVILLFEKPLPDSVSVTLNGETPILSDEGKTMTFLRAGELAAAEDAGASLAERELVFAADKAIHNELADAQNHALSNSFEIAVNFTQID
ncbi:MAG: hypothetical protein Q4C58_03180 [Eubacteriales bacterium]|nr:hypothetical protein [Eubacteriales bacterium]